MPCGRLSAGEWSAPEVVAVVVIVARIRLAHWRTGVAMDRDSLLSTQAKLRVVDGVASLEAQALGKTGSAGSTT